MIQDGSLVPRDAIRMAALGALLQGDRPYSEIAREVRQFTARIVGPSLELLGSSIELLRLEGLLEATSSQEADEPVLRLTETGLDALRDYLRADINPDASAHHRLLIALKLRFIGVLDTNEQLAQLHALERINEADAVRLDDLLERDEWHDGLLRDWLVSERAAAEQRAQWYRRMIAQRS